MNFHPNYPNDNNKGQNQVWRQIKDAFDRDEGIAYYRYPIFARTGRGRSEPDFLIVHRKYGVWVLESKGCQIGNIRSIEGHDWQMRDWYSETMSPVSQVEAQFYEVKTLVERDPELRSLRVYFDYRVVLPFISVEEWTANKFTDHPSVHGVVLLQDDMDRKVFRRYLKEASAGYMPSMTDGQWSRLRGAFRGVVSDNEPRKVKSGSPPENPTRVIHAVESRLRVLDEKQDRVAQEVPEGPQRIRGLAGTGKTVLFARRVAQMHASHPDWNIAFVYYSRSLNDTIKNLVEKVFMRMTGSVPEWDRLHIWHAWGSRDKTGFYREACIHWGSEFLNVSSAKELKRDGESEFSTCVRCLEESLLSNSDDIASFLDAIVIDEGQDLPAAFYRIAYQALREPKRLYWAYDEAQGVDSLVVPHAAEVFGRNDNGTPKVDLAGYYPSGMQKAHNMNKCYRTPRVILTAAHALNMGLLRMGGPLQGVTNKEDWNSLGYDVLEGDFSASSVSSGRLVTIERKLSASGHPVDARDFDIPFERESVLEVIEENKNNEAELVAERVENDLESGLRPEDIAIVYLGKWWEPVKQVENFLNQKGIQALVLDNTNKDMFKREGCVTLTGVRRAKGNEAYKVYALNLHEADPENHETLEDEMIARNQVFVALTRTKLWCVAIGRSGSILQELKEAKNNPGRITFRSFNQSSLKRLMTDSEGQVEMDF